MMFTSHIWQDLIIYLFFPRETPEYKMRLSYELIIYIYRVTHKGWDFRDDFTEFKLSKLKTLEWWMDIEINAWSPFPNLKFK